MPFWKWITNESSNAESDRTLYLYGVIAEESWLGDEVTPKQFRDELYAGSGGVTVYIHSPGGDVFAAAQIYTMLKEYPHRVTVKIDGLAASAASVVAMSGDEVLMSPVSMMMIHNPATMCWGDSDEMLRAKALLDEVKESIINAYSIKTSLPRTQLSKLMDDETWMDANKAVELGFADKVMFTENAHQPEANPQNKSGGMMFSRMAVTNSVINKLPARKPDASAGTPIESLDKRLSLILH